MREKTIEQNVEKLAGLILLYSFVYALYLTIEYVSYLFTVLNQGIDFIGEKGYAKSGRVFYRTISFDNRRLYFCYKIHPTPPPNQSGIGLVLIACSNNHNGTNTLPVVVQVSRHYTQIQRVAAFINPKFPPTSINKYL